MRRSRLSLRRLRWRTRAILNLVCIVLALALWYMVRGFPYLSWEQDLQCSLRRSLAHNADIIYSERVPDELGTWGDGADETVYIVRWQDTVGAMRLMRYTDGENSFFGPNRYVKQYPNRDGLFIIPLYGALPEEDGNLCGATVAVVALDPKVERVEMIYDNAYTDEKTVVNVHAEPAGSGVFLAEVDLGAAMPLPYHIYTGEVFAREYYGAVAYDGGGNVVTQTLPADGTEIGESGTTSDRLSAADSASGRGNEDAQE